MTTVFLSVNIERELCEFRKAPFLKIFPIGQFSCDTVIAGFFSSLKDDGESFFTINNSSKSACF